jgi:hypothetical protein
MATEILFEEIQATGQKKTRDFFAVLSCMFLFALITNLFIQKGEVTELTGGLFAGLCIIVLAAIFTSIRMITQFRKDGIYIRYPPFQPRFVYFAWSEIKQIQIRKYNALAEYNGWGIKTGLSGKSYTTGGDTGIQLELNNGTLVLIGTNQPNDVEKVLASRLSNKTHIPTAYR